MWKEEREKKKIKQKRKRKNQTKTTIVSIFDVFFQFLLVHRLEELISEKYHQT